MAFMVFDPYVVKKYDVRYTKNYQPNDGGWVSNINAKSVEEAVKAFYDDAKYFHREGAHILWIEEHYKDNYRKPMRYYFRASKGWVGSETWDESDI